MVAFMSKLKEGKNDTSMKIVKKAMFFAGVVVHQHFKFYIKKKRKNQIYVLYRKKNKNGGQ